jgi:hypothetical protein
MGSNEHTIEVFGAALLILGAAILLGIDAVLGRKRRVRRTLAERLALTSMYISLAVLAAVLVLGGGGPPTASRLPDHTHHTP